MSGPVPSKIEWVMEVAVISTCHLTEQTGCAEIQPDFSGLGGLLAVPMPDGFLVYNSDPDVLEDEEVPQDLRVCLRWANKLGFEWVRFDSAGSQVEGLPVYDW